ncbi:MAG TPA: hypothetical protein VF261_01935, partial [Candidatus Saccharimonadales bacterium]
MTYSEEYPYPHDSLSPEQRHNTAERIKSDSALLAAGAEVNEWGRLVITGAQRRELADRDGFYEQRRAWLDQSVADLVSGIPASTGVHSRIHNSLRRDGISTCRDILVVGKKKIRDVYTLGETSMAVIGQAVAANDYGITWKKAPTMADIAGLCANLSEVTSAAIMPTPLKTIVDRFPGSRELVTLSVQDIFDAHKGTGSILPLIADTHVR